MERLHMADLQKKLDRVHTCISTIIENDIGYGFPSAQLCVRLNHETVLSDCWGIKNSYHPDRTHMEHGDPVTEDTMYDLASNTKMYSVVYAIQYLHSRHMIDLDTPLVDILGQQFADDTIKVGYQALSDVSIETIREWKRSLTVRDLLCHRGGFMPTPPFCHRFCRFGPPYEGKAPENPLFSGNDGSMVTREKSLEAVNRTPLIYKPRSGILYSDADFVILGFVVEKITGMSLQNFLKQTFWTPMNLTRVTFNPLQHGFSKEDCCATELNGNSRDGAVSFEGMRLPTIQGEVHDCLSYYAMGGMSGHAGLFASATNLSELADLMHDGKAGSESYFSRETLELFTHPDDPEHDEWGIGWWRQGKLKRTYYYGMLASENTIGHQGWTGTLTAIDREAGLTVAFLTNKINSPVTDPTKEPNRFDGNWFTTATLGFAIQLLEMAVRTDADKDTLLAEMDRRVSDMEEQLKEAGDVTETHPAHRALNSIRESREQLKLKL